MHALTNAWIAFNSSSHISLWPIKWLLYNTYFLKIGSTGYCNFFLLKIIKMTGKTTRRRIIKYFTEYLTFLLACKIRKMYSRLSRTHNKKLSELSIGKGGGYNRRRCSSTEDGATSSYDVERLKNRWKTLI